MNSIKKCFLTSIMACVALFLCGIGQTKAQAAPAGLSYSFTAYDAKNWGPVTPYTKEIKYLIKIVNHTATSYPAWSITIQPIQFCLKGLLFATMDSTNMDYGCHFALPPTKTNPLGYGVVDTVPDALTAYGTVVFSPSTTFNIYKLNAPIKGTINGNPQPPYPFNGTMITCIDFYITLTPNTAPLEIQLCDVVMTPHVFNGTIQNPKTYAITGTEQGTIE